MSTPPNVLIEPTSATSATTGMVFIGLLSHMTPLETVTLSQPLISLRRFGDDLFGQIVINQQVRTEIKYLRSAVSVRIYLVSDSQKIEEDSST